MIRRNTERVHPIADQLFIDLGIYDLQGLLREQDKNICGVECYQLGGSEIFSLPITETEIQRYYFCKALGIPYYIITSSPTHKTFQIYCLDESVANLIHLSTFNEAEFLQWWARQQSFNQKKAMYEAANRILSSYIDKLLFSNNLAWGVNIDGFKLSPQRKIEYILEKRVTSRYNVRTYDPNKFFHGTQQKSGDYLSWRILKHLADSLNVPLILATFDTNSSSIGITRILDVSAQHGLTYSNQIAVYNNSTEIQKFLSQII